MFDGLRIRNKLVLLVAGPMVIIVLLATIGTFSRRETAARSADLSKMVSAAEANAALIDALQSEAIYSTGFVASGRKQWRNEVTEARRRTDEAAGPATAALHGPVATMSSNLHSTSTLAQNAFDKVVNIRATVDRGFTWTQVAEAYQVTENPFLIINETIASTVSDPTVGAKLRTASAIAAYKASIARQGSVLLGAREAGTFGTAGIAQYKDARAEEQSKEAILNSLASTNQKGTIRDALATPGRLGFDSVRAAAVNATAESPFDSHTPEQIASYTGEVLSSLHEVEVNLDRELVRSADSTRQEAERAATLFVIGAVLAVALAAAAAILLGRKITRPLRTLTDAAEKLSNEQMPKLVESLRNPSEDAMAYQVSSLDKIDVGTRDEIGQLATAFNNVQKVAGEVATEQASLLRKGIGEMFVNLARRNQALLDRQIDFIDELEGAEEDPDQLENLYRLDHLATRMRRNAESLLVLAGAEPPRRRGRPAPLANVVRAALAEVEDFARIELLSLDEVLVASNAAADIAHLLSELMENATNFSPPETKVEVVGHRTKADGYIVSVSDQGIGMSADQMAEANELLAKPPVVGLALSRSLGFIVVGRLARRHDITVKIIASTSGGVTALVTLPPALITDALGNATATPREPAVSERPIASRLEANAEAEASFGSGLEFAPGVLEQAESDDRGGAADPGDHGPAAPLTFSPGAPTGPTRRPVVHAPSPNGHDNGRGLPTRRLTATPAPSRRNGHDHEEAVATEPEPSASPRRVIPPPSVFDAPPADAAPDVEATTGEGVEDGESAHTDGPPPVAPLRARAPKTAARPQASRPRKGSDGAFLAEAQPPKLFGVRDTAEVADRNQETTVAPDEPVAEPVLTPSGLAKRTPRSAGASRNIPGADSERGVGATKRSPEEVRSLLSRYRDGQQRGRSTPTNNPVVEEIEQ